MELKAEKRRNRKKSKKELANIERRRSESRSLPENQIPYDPELPGTVKRLNSLGLTEWINAETGEVVATQMPPEWIRKKWGEGKPVGARRSLPLVRDGNGRWIPDPMNHPRNKKSGALEVYPFHPLLAEAICEYVMEGWSLADISRIEGMPPVHTIYRWEQKYSEFKGQIQEARRIRAHYFADRIHEKAEHMAPETVYRDRAQIDAYKWLAEKSNPENYGKRTVVQGDQEKPIRIEIASGITRPGDPGHEAIDIQGEVVGEQILQGGETDSGDSQRWEDEGPSTDEAEKLDSEKRE